MKWSLWHIFELEPGLPHLLDADYELRWKRAIGQRLLLEMRSNNYCLRVYMPKLQQHADNFVRPWFLSHPSSHLMVIAGLVLVDTQRLRLGLHSRSLNIFYCCGSHAVYELEGWLENSTYCLVSPFHAEAPVRTEREA